MKTKNIFRMLLVAALLMGANNVKATEETVWSGSSGEIYYGAIELSITNFTSKGVAVGKYLRVYTSERTNGWNFDIKTPSGTSLGFTNWQGESNNINVKTENCYNSTDNYFEFTISQTFIEQVTSLGFQIQCWNMIINRITISDTSGISGGGTSTTDVPVWTGSVWSGKWGENGSRVFLDNGTFSSLKCDGKDIIRVYGTLGDIGLDDWGNAWFIQFLGGNWQPQGGWECLNRSSNTEDGFTGYVDFEVTSEVASILKNNTNSSDGKCAILQGHNITFTSIVVNPSSTTTSYTVTAAATTNGSINYDATNTSHRAGSSYTFSVTPANGYSIGTVSIVDENGDDISSEVHLTRGQTTNGATTYTFVVPEMNVVITATFTEIVTIDATIDATYGAITFSCEVPVVIPSGITAYYAKQVTNSTVELLPVTGIIPAETGVVLFGDAGTYTFTEASSAGQTITGNLLTPVLDERGYICERDNQYVLTWHDRLVFAQTGSENYAYVPYGKAYLDLGSAVSSSRLRISLGNGNESTGIQSLYSDERSLDGAIYNLRGQRVEHPTKGLYIINGKKVMIK